MAQTGRMQRSRDASAACFVTVALFLTACTHHRATEADPAIYPSPRPGGGGSLIACPSSAGVGVPEADAAAKAVRAFLSRGMDKQDDLRKTDPAWWSQVDAVWAANPSSARPQVTPEILWKGRLRAMPELGVPRQYDLIARYCGKVVADRSVVVIDGPRDEGALQGAHVYLERRGHLLMYFEYP
jgi:hypothetical protein